MRSGYITDRTCPVTPEHGALRDMRDGGHYCSHHAHDVDPMTKSFWTGDEFEAAKSLPTNTATTNGNVKIAVNKPQRRARRKR